MGARRLEGGEARRTAVAQAVEVDAGFGDDVGHRHLAAPRVEDADHRGLAHARLFEQHFFDLARIDVEAAGDDQLGGAPAQREAAGGVQLAHVAGPEPAFGERVRRRLRVAPVAGETVGPLTQTSPMSPLFTGWSSRSRTDSETPGSG